jgi:hypothetical protein
MKNIEIEKIFNPEINVLKECDGVYEVTISDAELDELKCTYNGDDCVQIDTDELTYIILTRENLNLLKKYLDKVEKLNNE